MGSSHEKDQHNMNRRILNVGMKFIAEIIFHVVRSKYLKGPVVSDLTSSLPQGPQGLVEFAHTTAPLVWTIRTLGTF